MPGLLERFRRVKRGFDHFAIFGIPVGATHTVTGAIVGVGATRRLTARPLGHHRQIVGFAAKGLPRIQKNFLGFPTVFAT